MQAKGRSAPVLEQEDSRFHSASSLMLTTACVHAARRPASCAATLACYNQRGRERHCFLNLLPKPCPNFASRGAQNEKGDDQGRLHRTYS